MLVKFGGMYAEDVKVYSDTELTCITPRNDPGQVQLTLSNLDDDGAPIVGETTTTAAAVFVYSRPTLASASHLQKVIRTLIRELKRQVVPNVNHRQHVDYGEEEDIDGDGVPDHIGARKADVPSITLVGPNAPQNRFYSTNGHVEVVKDGKVFLRRAPKTVNLDFVLLGESDSTAELLSLWQSVEMFFYKNVYLHVSDGMGGEVRYELTMNFVGMKDTGVASTSNVRRFAGSVCIRGVNIESIPGREDDMISGNGEDVADDIQLDIGIKG